MTKPRHRPAALLLSMSSLVLVAPAWATSTVETPIQAGGNFTVPTVSMKDVRYRSTIRQQYDFSCGSAAVATLLTHHYAYSVREEDVFAEMFQRGDQNKIRREGFSLLDMKLYLEAHGFKADGFEAGLDDLARANIPAIVLINERGYGHFVVVKGLRDGRVLMGDPSTGVRALPREQFEEIWKNRILFVVRNRTDVAAFNRDTDWSLAPRSPIEVGLVQRSLDAITIPKRGAGDF